MFDGFGQSCGGKNSNEFKFEIFYNYKFISLATCFMPIIQRKNVYLSKNTCQPQSIVLYLDESIFRTLFILRLRRKKT